MLPTQNFFLCPVLIGRSAQMEVLQTQIHQARAGRGQVVLLAGEAGIGKSRLVAETRGLAEAAGFAVLRGNCFEPDRVLPYAPLLDLLRQRWAGLPVAEISADLGTAVYLTTLFPEWLNVLPERPFSPPSEPEQERHRLIQTFATYFSHLATRQPLLLIVEDLHWCDEATLETLLTLTRRLATQPVFLLFTYRQDEAVAELATFLTILQRERLATALQLSPLTMTEASSFIAATLRQPVDDNLLRPLYAVSEGNPFFIEELLQTLNKAVDRNEQGIPKQYTLTELRLPRSVQVAVQRRLSQVSPAARKMLTIAAVAGRRFDFHLLQALTGYDETTLTQLLKELIQAQLVVEETADLFSFRHALTQQAVTADLLKREQRQLHQLIAETIEKLSAQTADPPFVDLAAHFFAAESWQNALTYAHQAGKQAQSLYAPRAAIEQFSRALEAAHRLGLHPPPDIARARGHMYELLGSFELAQADYLQAYEAARATHHHQEAWQSLLALGWLWTGRDYAQAGEYLQQAVDQARQIEDPVTLARTLNRVGNWHVHAEQPQKGIQYHLEALTIFETLPDRADEAATLDLLAIAHFMGGDLLAGEKFYERAILLYRALKNAQGLSTTLAPFATRGANFMHDTMVQSAVSLADCVQELEEAVSLAQQIDWRPGEAQAWMYMGLSLGPRGAYAQALHALENGLRVASEIEHHVWMTGNHFTRCAVLRDLLVLPQARQHGEMAFEMAQQIGSRFLISSSAAFLALTCISQGELGRAQTILQQAAGGELPMQTLAQRLLWRARVELALAQQGYEEALRTVTALIESAVRPQKTAVIPRLWYLQGQALVGIGRLAEAEAVWQAALSQSAAQGTLPMLWRIHAALSRLYQTTGQREKARTATQAAEEIINQLAANVSDVSLRHTFLQQTQIYLPHLSPPTANQTAKYAFAGLTRREREIAALVAVGKSNRAIADDLTLSERTVAKHVENILSKLYFTSRAQIAAWAVEKGLSSR